MVEYSQFKGNKIIVLKRKPDDKFPVSFGVMKAQLILDNIEAIKKFVADNPIPAGKEPVLPSKP